MGLSQKSNIIVFARGKFFNKHSGVLMTGNVTLSGMQWSRMGLTIYLLDTSTTLGMTTRLTNRACELTVGNPSLRGNQAI